jgi:hypothetical protein
MDASVSMRRRSAGRPFRPRVVFDVPVLVVCNLMLGDVKLITTGSPKPRTLSANERR